MAAAVRRTVGWMLAAGAALSCLAGSACHSSSSSDHAGGIVAASAVDAGISVVPTWEGSDDAGPPAGIVMGHNAIWCRGGLGLWDDTTHAANAAVAPLVSALHPAALRFPGGTRAMRYNFSQAIGPLASRTPQCDPFTGETDPTGYGVDEFMSVAESLGASVTLVTSWVDGSPQEAAAFVAYVNASGSSTFALGVDVNGIDWQTAGYWAQQRATNGHAAPYGAKFVEIGNEPYSSLPVGPATSCGRPSQFVQDQRWVNGVAIPTTAKDYAAQLALTGALIRGVDPTILIGAPAPATFDGLSNAAQALGDVDAQMNDGDPWSPRLLSDAPGAFDFFVLHPYDFTTSDSNLELAEAARTAIHELRALAPSTGIGLTEFGFLLNGDTDMDAIVSADMVRMALEEGVLVVTRHVLIEDVLTEPFGSNALIGGSANRLSPAYAIDEALAAVVSGATRVDVPAQPQADVVVLALAESGGGIAVVAIDRRANPVAATDLAIAIPPGTWHGTLDAWVPTQTTADTVVPMTSTPLSATGVLALQLGSNGVAIATLTR